MMPTNTEIVLKTNYEEWKKQRIGSYKGRDPWLYYCVSQFLKPYDLNDEELQSGLTDGGNDGGADGIYIFANQRQLVTEDTELDSRNVTKLRVLIFQVKLSGGFKTTEIDKWIPLSEDMFNLSKPANSFGLRYNVDVVAAMDIWKNQYIKVSGSFPEVRIDYYYITGDEAAPNSVADDSGHRLRARVEKLVKSECLVNYVDAYQLWEQVQRRPPSSKTLKWAEQPMNTLNGFVGLVPLKQFDEFLQDEPGVLAERMFESNVRGYQQGTPVNSQIQRSLTSRKDKVNFWMLNNGVTIITERAIPIGYLQLGIDDPQIVNGLQTSREIFSYCRNFDLKNDIRSVLVRVIQTADPEVWDDIIRATNSQNRLPPASLRMTDQVHRDIEELFRKSELYYDRRKGFYKDQGRPIARIVSANAVLQAVVSVLLQRPDDARARPGDYFKEDAKYESVFAHPNISLSAILSCVQLVRRVEQYLDDNGVESSDQKNLKFYIAALLAREQTNLAMPVPAKLLAGDDMLKIKDDTIDDCYRRIKSMFDKLSQTHDKDTVARGPELLKSLNRHWGRRRGAAKSTRKKRK
jgi:hypothetical protein